MTIGLAENPSNPHITVNEIDSGYEAVDCAGSSDVTLTDAQVNHAVHEFTGVLTGSISVIVPDDTHIYRCINNTTGAFTITIKTVAGTGIVVAQTKTAIVCCDGTNVVRLTADV